MRQLLFHEVKHGTHKRKLQRISDNKDVTFYKLTEADHGGVYFWHETTLKIVDNFIKDRLQ